MLTLMKFANDIEQLGGKMWLVGGAIRDEILNKKISDRDFLITGINVSDFHGEKIVGKDFPVFLKEIDGKICEIAFARKERKTGLKHSDFEIITNKNIKIEEDLKRRDFTINAIAKNVLTDEIIDPFNGRQDLENRILRHVSDAFSEDPERVFRGARFATSLNFEIAEDTKKLMKKLKSQLKFIESERVWLELKKVLKCNNPSIFFETLKEIDCLDVFFKEINDFDEMNFKRIMKILNFGVNEIEKFGILVHNLTPVQIRDFCRRIKIPNKFRDFGILCSTELGKFHDALKMKPEKFVPWVLQQKINFINLLNISGKILSGEENSNLKLSILHFDKIFHRALKVFEIEKRITGKELIKEGFKPGIKFGNILLRRRIESFKNDISKS